jgi:hypothetical protein
MAARFTHGNASGRRGSWGDGRRWSLRVGDEWQERWLRIERLPTRELWDKLFEPETLKAAAASLRQLAKRARRWVLTPEQRRERWRLASQLRRARNAPVMLPKCRK